MTSLITLYPETMHTILVSSPDFMAIVLDALHLSQADDVTPLGLALLHPLANAAFDDIILPAFDQVRF
jgi:hypothetical protein